MKKRITALLCVAVALLSLAIPVRAATVCFTAVNDTINELSDSTMPAFIGGELYVPYSVFINTTLNIGYIYDRTSMKFTLYHDDIRLAFNMTTGKAYDQKGNSYDKQTAMRNSRVYVPVQFVCDIFGLNFAYLTDSTIGAVARITNANAYIDNASFTERAAFLMSTYIAEYEAAHPADVVQQPTTTPPTRPPVASGDVSVFLSFEGLTEYTDKILDTLEEYDCAATFFVTSQEISENAGLIRKIAGKGHSIGIKCVELSDYTEASELLFKAAKLKTLLITAPGGISALDAAAEGLILWEHPDGGGVLEASRLNLSETSARIDEEEKRADMRLDCSPELLEALSPVLSYLHARGYNVKSITETDVPYIGSEGE